MQDLVTSHHWGQGKERELKTKGKEEEITNRKIIRIRHCQAN